jgi:hypothetical protein
MYIHFALWTRYQYFIFAAVDLVFNLSRLFFAPFAASREAKSLHESATECENGLTRRHEAAKK